MDLWSLAAARLRDKDNKTLDFGTTVDLQDLLSSVKDSKDECERKQWVVNNVVLRDIFSKIAVWIQKFIEVGDIAIQYDPGHAALPWAAVRFVFKASIQDVQRHSTVIEGIERVANIIAECRIVEQLYLAEEFQSTQQLKDCLIRLYAQVLVFLAKAKRFYEKNTASRAFQSITDVGNKFQVQLERLGKLEQKVWMSKDLVATQSSKESSKNLERQFATLSLKEGSNHQRLVSLLQDMKRPINRMDKASEDFYDSLDAEERARILRWLSSTPYIEHHKQAQKDILAGTGQWFLTNERVLEWQKSSSSSIMWLHGPPGFGKSKLVSVCIALHRLQHTPSLLTANRAILIEKYLGEFEHGRNPNPVYFYCTRNPAEPERGSPEGVLRNLVRQLSCLQPGEPVLDPVRTIYKAREQDNFAAGALNEKECTDLIIELCQYLPLTTIIIDALDECGSTRRHELFDAMSTILQRSRSLVKVLVASRDDRDITLFLEGCLNLEIDVSKSSEDIGHFVTKEVERLVKSKRLLSGKVPADLCAEIKKTLQSEAHGMFRWVSLQLQYLCGLKLEAAVRKRLGRLPPDLRELYNSTYVQMLDTYEDEERSITENVFHLLMCLQQQLDARNFIRAESSYRQEKIELSKENVLDLCSNFVVLDTELDVFRFAHLSVREFLEWKGGYEAEQNHAFAARCCMNFLSRMSHDDTRCTKDDPDDFKALWNKTTNKSLGASDLFPSFVIMGISGDRSADRLYLNKFHAYAMFYWPYHLLQSRDCRMSPQFKDIHRDFMIGENGTVSRSFVYWNCLVWRGQGYEPPFDITGWSTRHAYKISHTRSDPADPLFCASIFGFDDILELRMQNEPVALNLGASYRALSFALMYGNDREAKLLLEAGVRWDKWKVTRLHNDLPFPTPYFSWEDMGGTALDWSGKYNLFHTLHAFAAMDSIPMLQLLLAYGADTEVKDDSDDTPLHLAAANGHEKAVSLLLEHHVGMDKSSKSFWTAATCLQKAVKTGSESRLAQLLADWPKGDQETLYLRRVLWNAVARNEEACVDLLLSKGASVHGVFRGKPILERALNICGRKKFPLAEPTILKKLIEYSTDVKVLFDGGRALSYAIRVCTEDAIRVLLDAGADIDAEHGAPLKYAISAHRLSVVRLLLERGASVNARTNFGISILRFAKHRGSEETVELLIQYGAEDMEQRTWRRSIQISCIQTRRN